MCNSRGITDNSENSSSKKATKPALDLSKVVFKCAPTKLGRKGDPRMQQAMEARLNNPSLSLLEALEIGGFKFHWEGEVSYDTEGIQLSQRKNQLSRRLRLFKNNLLKNREGASVTDGGKDEGRAVRQSRASAKRKKKNAAAPKKKTCTSDGETANTVPKGSGDNVAVSVSPSAESAALESQSSSSAMPSLNGNGFSIGMQAMSGIDHHDSEFPHQSSDMRHASIPVNPTSASSNYSQGIVSLPSPSSSVSFTSSSTHSQLPCNTDQTAQRLNQALNQFSSDSEALMKRCMMSAGFTQNEAEECDEMYITFFEKALENEKSKLESYKSRFNALMAENNCPQLQTVSSASVPYPAGQSIGRRDSFPPPAFGQGLVKPVLPTGIISSFANVSRGGDILDPTSLSHLRRIAAEQGSIPSSSQQASSYSAYNFNTPCEANVVQSNSIIGAANSGWNRNRTIPAESFSDLDGDLNPSVSQIQSWSLILFSLHS